MKIESIEVVNDGYINCKSSFYTTCDMINELVTYHFINGLNTLVGDIDSGVWGISYLLSMYKYDKNNENKKRIFLPLTITVNHHMVNLEQFWTYSCYMDRIYPLFASKKTVEHQVLKGIKKNGFKETDDEIRELFHIDKDRFIRPLSCVGNELFRCMAAIGYVNMKEVFCFPWLSRIRYNGFHKHMDDLFDILCSLNKILIVPLGKE